MHPFCGGTSKGAVEPAATDRVIATGRFSSSNSISQV
jgi:hypothetical protein